jgi:selenocysteine lyase/cysteine desulfurase
VRLYGPDPSQPRTSTLSLTIDGFTSTEVATRLATRGLFVSNGDFYAHTVIERLGKLGEGLVRVGCVCYTSDVEVERLLDAIREIAAS